VGTVGFTFTEVPGMVVDGDPPPKVAGALATPLTPTTGFLGPGVSGVSGNVGFTSIGPVVVVVGEIPPNVVGDFNAPLTPRIGFFELGGFGDVGFTKSPGILVVVDPGPEYSFAAFVVETVADVVVTASTIDLKFLFSFSSNEIFCSSNFILSIMTEVIVLIIFMY
jgi:hypothetical protein